MEVLINKIAIKAIHFYQKYLSPQKGYSCAHNALHGNGSCSSWAISLIESKGVLELASQFGARVSECNEASKKLSDKHKRKNNEESPADAACNSSDIGCCFASWPTP